MATERERELIREFVQTTGWLPGEVTLHDDGTTIDVTMRPAMSSRTLLITARITAVREL